MTERTEWKFLGKVIGTVIGWDGEMERFILFEFVPSPGVGLDHGDLVIDITKGTFEYHDLEGKVTKSYDVISVMKQV